MNPKSSKPAKNPQSEPPAMDTAGAQDAAVDPPEAVQDTALPDGEHADLPAPELPAPDLPDPAGNAPSALEPEEPLSEREKHLVNIVTRQVLSQIDPLLIKLQQISNEAVSMGAEQKLRELERGINERVESRIQKINALIGRRRQ